jgi:hypothetical protein
MRSQKVPGMVVMQCNGMTHVNACLLTFKAESLRAHRHTHTHICSFDRAIVRSTDGRRIPLRPIFRVEAAMSYLELNPLRTVVG